MNVYAGDTLTHGGGALAATEPGREQFTACLATLEAAVRAAACTRQREWPARVACGIQMALDFAVANPEAARTLAIESRAAGREGSGGGDVVGHFSPWLERTAPVARIPASSDKALVSAIAGVIRDHLRLGASSKRLEERTSDLVYLTLLPYLGFAGAQHWSQAFNTSGM